MDVTLISSKFSSTSGSGLAGYSHDLYTELSKLCRISKIDLSIEANYLKIPLLFDEFNRRMYFRKHTAEIRKKNIHFLHPLAEPKYLKHLNKKIVSVFDFYVLDDNYSNKIYPKEAKLYKKVIVSGIRKNESIPKYHR